MLSKNQIKIFASLKEKKYREQYQLFVAEGTKLCTELLNSQFEIEQILVTKKWLERNQNINLHRLNFEVIQESELQKISSLRTPQEILVIAKIPTEISGDYFSIKNELCLFFDTIQDPGNFGTNLRIADWFGINHIFCTNNSVDLYNPKTVQATMGAICRVNVEYVSASVFFQKLNKTLPEFPIYGTFIDAENIYKEKLSSNGLIVFGNEGNGISEEIEKFVMKRIRIPNFPENSKSSESLNVSTACSIVCSEFRRRS